MKKRSTKVAHNRPKFFFSTAIRLKTSPNLNFCSIKIAHRTLNLCIMTLHTIHLFCAFIKIYIIDIPTGVYYVSHSSVSRLASDAYENNTIFVHNKV